MDVVELLIGIAEIATALAGFTGVVVAFGSRSQGSWHPGDQLRLGFLLEASLTAGGFSLLTLLLLSFLDDRAMTWRIASALWFGFMCYSLWRARRRIGTNVHDHGDVDRLANRLTVALFMTFMALQLVNVFYWHALWPFLGAIILNLAGAAMQFARLIRSAFRN